MAVLLQGCYYYAAAPEAPAVGSTLRLELNDAGRVSLGDSIGSAARSIEGRTISVPDSAFSLRVTKVGYFGGQTNNWSGEPLRIPKPFVMRATEKRFSRSRTFMTVGAVAVALVTFVSTRDLLGFGNDGKDGGRPTPIPD